MQCVCLNSRKRLSVKRSMLIFQFANDFWNTEVFFLSIAEAIRRELSSWWTVSGGCHEARLDVQVLSPVYSCSYFCEIQTRRASPCFVLERRTLPWRTLGAAWADLQSGRIAWGSGPSWAVGSGVPASSGSPRLWSVVLIHTLATWFYTTKEFVLQLTVLKEFFFLNYVELSCNKPFLISLALVLTHSAVCNAPLLSVALSSGKPVPVSEMQ